MLAVADAKDVSPHAITDPTLFDCIDVESVSRLVEDGPTGAAGTESVRFDYDDSLIEVRADGLVGVFEPVGDAR